MKLKKLLKIIDADSFVEIALYNGWSAEKPFYIKPVVDLKEDIPKKFMEREIEKTYKDLYSSFNPVSFSVAHNSNGVSFPVAHIYLKEK